MVINQKLLGVPYQKGTTRAAENHKLHLPVRIFECARNFDQNMGYSPWFSTRRCNFDVSNDDSKEKAFQGKHNGANVSITTLYTSEHKIHVAQFQSKRLTIVHGFWQENF